MGRFELRPVSLAETRNGRFVVASDEFEPPDLGPHYRMGLPV